MAEFGYFRNGKCGKQVWMKTRAALQRFCDIGG
jgi:hypothetical protein